MTEIIVIARATKKTLRRKFSSAKFSVTSDSNGIRVQWTDDGPTAAEVRNLLIETELARLEERQYGADVLRIVGQDYGYFWLDRYNAAERIAKAEKWERVREEREAQERHTAEVIRQASKAKYAAIEPLKDYIPPPIQDTTVFEAFERFRQRAESEVTIHDTDRRPSWAPPLILGEELAEVCLELGYLTLDDK